MRDSNDRGFEWKKIGVLDRWLLTRGGRRWRFHCKIICCVEISACDSEIHQ